MMGMRDVPDLHVTLRRSRWRTAFIVATALATMILVLVLPMAAGMRAVMMAACTAAAAWELRSAARCDGWRLTLGMDRRIVVEAAGHQRDGLVLDATYVTHPLVCIVWREHRRWRSRVITVPRDALPAEDHRKLRVWLRYSRGAPGASESLDASAASWMKGDLPT
jgi:hypothetical protein